MAHPAQQDFCSKVRTVFAPHFIEKRVLDIGSLDINGNNRQLFEGCEYTGIDVAPGPNVDLVTLAHEHAAPDASFDTIISTECLEHDQHFEKSLQNAVRMLKPGGLLVLTCATEGRAEHGTVHSDGGYASPLTARMEGWENYYRNLKEEDIRSAIPVDAIFERYEFLVNRAAADLYFWGIKRSK